MWNAKIIFAHIGCLMLSEFRRRGTVMNDEKQNKEKNNPKLWRIYAKRAIAIVILTSSKSYLICVINAKQTVSTPTSIYNQKLFLHYLINAKCQSHNSAHGYEYASSTYLYKHQCFTGHQLSARLPWLLTFAAFLQCIEQWDYSNGWTTMHTYWMYATPHIHTYVQTEHTCWLLICSSHSIGS